MPPSNEVLERRRKEAMSKPLTRILQTPGKTRFPQSSSAIAERSWFTSWESKTRLPQSKFINFGTKASFGNNVGEISWQANTRKRLLSEKSGVYREDTSPLPDGQMSPLGAFGLHSTFAGEVTSRDTRHGPYTSDVPMKEEFRGNVDEDPVGYQGPLRPYDSSQWSAADTLRQESRGRGGGTETRGREGEARDETRGREGQTREREERESVGRLSAFSALEGGGGGGGGGGRSGSWRGEGSSGREEREGGGTLTRGSLREVSWESEGGGAAADAPRARSALLPSYAPATPSPLLPYAWPLCTCYLFSSTDKARDVTALFCDVTVITCSATVLSCDGTALSWDVNVLSCGGWQPWERRGREPAAVSVVAGPVRLRASRPPLRPSLLE